MSDGNTSPLLQSDHSKILIADGLSLSPRMLIGSKNLSDHASGMNFDEAVVVSGPAATIAQLRYQGDIVAALLQAYDESSLDTKQVAEVKWWISEIKRTSSQKEILVNGHIEDAKVQYAENNANDSVRNAEMTLLQAIEKSRESVEFYAMGMIPFGIDFVNAVARAINRGVKVRALLDPRTGELSGRLFIAQLVRLGAIASRTDSAFRWRTLLPAVAAETTKTGMPVSQQQHTKTVIIDGNAVYIGSVNFDMFTFASTFREASVLVEDRETAQNALSRFNRIFSTGTASMDYITAHGKILPSEKEKLLRTIGETYQGIWGVTRGRINLDKFTKKHCY